MDTNTPKFEKIGELTSEIKSQVTLDNTQIVVAGRIGSPTKRSGRRPYWLCPFHSDKDASFSINPKDGKCGCFSCGAYFSNPIDFVMEYDGVSYEEAVLIVGNELGYDTSFDISTIEKKSPSIRIIENDVEKQLERKMIDPKVYDIVYRAFIAAHQLNSGKLYLLDKHYEELSQKRGYNDAEIKEFQFFSMHPDSNMIVSRTIAILKNWGYDERLLAYVPGFFYSRAENDKGWRCTRMQQECYAFPLHDANGLITGIQIRITGQTNGSKYIWFASTFAMFAKESSSKFLYGNSPAAPLSVVYPEGKKCENILITEGFHKAVRVARHSTLDKYAVVTVQGVNNTNGIGKFLQEVVKETGAKKLCIAFDGDMVIKEQVLKAALKIGLNLCGLHFNDTHIATVRTLLASGDKDATTVVSSIKENFNELSKFIRDGEQNYWFESISYLTWTTEKEKGIDDLMLANKENCIKKVSLADFVDNAYKFLSVIDDVKLKIVEQNGSKFRMISLSAEQMELIYKKVVNQ